MSNEIRITSGIAVSNGNLSFTQQFGTKQYDQASVGGPVPGQLTIGTTEEDVSLGDLTTPGWCIMQNLDDTNFCQWGFSAGVYGGRLGPGETAGPFRLDPGLASLYMKADTAAVKVLIYAFED